MLCTGKITQVTWTYGKKVVDSANNGTEATEEPTELLTSSMLQAMVKQAITHRNLSVSNFFKDLNINLLAVNFFWSDVPLLSVPAKKNFRDVVAVVNLGSFDVVFSCGFVSCLSLNPDDQVEMNIFSLNGVEKKTRSVLFDVLERLDTFW